MNDFKLKGYRIHVSIKIPHLHQQENTFSYQFLIYDKNGHLMNYPFSRIIAHNDDEFKSTITSELAKILANRDVLREYPVSKFIANLQS